jgi:uncharacterized FlaG/YvyC family protein
MFTFGKNNEDPFEEIPSTSNQESESKIKNYTESRKNEQKVENNKKQCDLNQEKLEKLESILTDIDNKLDNINVGVSCLSDQLFYCFLVSGITFFGFNYLRN